MFYTIIFNKPRSVCWGPVDAASDAFGISIGRESLGLYTTRSVRGFSPTLAGNVRIDGLYFDPAADLNPALRQSTQLRVGLSAQGFVFPAPTGIVDHQLRRPEASPFMQTQAGIDGFGSRYLDLTASRPLTAQGGWAVNGGASLTHTAYGNTNAGTFRAASAGLWWRPDARTEAGLFASVHDQLRDQAGPQLAPIAGDVPPPLPWRSDGPHWASYSGTRVNHGALWRRDWAGAWGRWTLRAGAFHSAVEHHRNFSILLQALLPDGSGRRLVVADPPAALTARSGEVRLSWTFGDARWAQRLHAQLSGRERVRLSGGSQRIDFGPMRLGEPFEPPMPAFEFGPRTTDRVVQSGLGLAYELRAMDRLEMGIGLQRAAYRKRVQAPDLPPVQTPADPWLGHVGGAWHLSPALAAYAGLSRGLEESGVAPASATNGGSAMPAILTRQSEIGLRWQYRPQMKLVAGLFDVRKPYYNLDASNLFTVLGDVRHRGMELSLSGDATPTLRVVAGAVLMRPRVTGEAVRTGRVGERPLGVPERLFKLNAVWRPHALRGIGIDAALHRSSSVPATRDNRVSLPGSTRLDLGLRAPLALMASRGTLRLLVSNVGNERGYDLVSAGHYFGRQPRLVAASWTADW